MINLNNEYIKHNNSMDVCYHIFRFEDYDTKHYLISVKLVNIGFITSYYIDKDNQYDYLIEKNKLNEWQICLNPYDFTCLRDSNWENLNNEEVNASYIK